MTRVEDFRFLMTGQTAEIVDLVVAERGRQEAKGAEKRAAGYDWRTCADPAMPGGDGVKLAVLGEEVGEVAKTICDEAAGEYAAGPIENRARALEHRLGGARAGRGCGNRLGRGSPCRDRGMGIVRLLASAAAAFAVVVLLAGPARAGGWHVSRASSYSSRSTGSDVQGCAGAPRLRDWQLSVATFLVPCGARVRICVGRRCVTARRWDSGPFLRGRFVPSWRGFDLNVGVVRALGFPSSRAWGVRTIRWRRLP